MAKKTSKLDILGQAEFEVLWAEFKAHYPKRHSIAACSFHEGRGVAAGLVANYGLEIMHDLIKAADNYAKEIRMQEKEFTCYVKQAPTFLRSDRWREYLEVEDITPQQKAKHPYVRSVEDVLETETRRFPGQNAPQWHSDSSGGHQEGV